MKEQLQALEGELSGLDNLWPKAMILRELPQPRASHTQVRGDFLRQGPEIHADTPHALPPLRQTRSTEESRPGRRDLAAWLMRPDHPLTARVTVNRIWMRLFGRGLVETEDDFGAQGTLPTHPELLDWLAREFQRDWSTKRLLRLIVTSSVYRQSSATRDDCSRSTLAICGWPGSRGCESKRKSCEIWPSLPAVG